MASLLAEHPPLIEAAVFATAALLLTIAAATLTLVVYHWIDVRRRRRLSVGLPLAAAYLAPRLVRGGSLEPVIDQARRRWGHDVVCTVLRRFRLALEGSLATQITEILENTGEIARLQANCASRFALRRRQALALLGASGGSGAISELLQALDDPKSDIRRVARQGLLTQRRSETTDAAIGSFMQEPTQRKAWARSFFARLAAVAPQKLCVLIQSGQMNVAYEKLSLEALCEVENVGAAQLALERVSSPSPELRATAARVIGKLQWAAGLRVLTEMLRDSEWFVRAAAARSLGTVTSGQDTINALLECLTDTSWWVRTNAAQSLSRLRTSGADLFLETQPNVQAG